VGFSCLFAIDMPPDAIRVALSLWD